MSLNRNSRRKLAEETLEIVKNGFYLSSASNVISIEKDVRKCVENTRTFTSTELDDMCSMRFEPKYDKCLIEVTEESTLAAARRLINVDGERRVICLNFASAKNAGGGFLSGSGAQEESLARSSALYASISTQQIGYYAVNRGSSSCFYTDSMIYSPDVPVFRDNHGSLLTNGPYLTSFITAPAVNVKGLKQTKKLTSMENVRNAMFRRTEKLLSLCARMEGEVLVLGAWGCGVFENDPIDVATYFKRLLLTSLTTSADVAAGTKPENTVNDQSSANAVMTASSNNNIVIKSSSDSGEESGRFARCFKRVVFAILTNGGADRTLDAFRNVLDV